MFYQVKNIPKRTIIWFTLFCLISTTIYALVVGYWAAYIFPIVQLMHIWPSIWPLVLMGITGAVTAAVILATPLALLTKQKSLILGLSLGVVTIAHLLALAPLTEFNSKLWWVHIGEYLIFILSCSLITRHSVQVFRVKNT